MGFKIQEWTVPTGHDSWCLRVTPPWYFPDKISVRASEQVALPSLNVREIRNNQPQFSSYSFLDTGYIHKCVEWVVGCRGEVGVVEIRGGGGVMG